MTVRRVIHIVESLDMGAVENWLVRMLGHAQTVECPVNWTFYCTLGSSGRIEARAQLLGAEVIYSPAPIGDKLNFLKSLRTTLRAGDFDVMHCHHDLISSVYLLAGAGLPIALRIVHIHNSDEAVLTSNPLKKALYREPMRQTCLALADKIVGISQHTLDTFLAGRARRPGKDFVLYYGIEPFSAVVEADRRAARIELGLPAESLILLFGGRLVPEKNPMFVIDVLVALRRLEPRAVGIFAGAGSLEKELTLRAQCLGVESAVRMLGWRNDLSKIMSISDWFILPRPEHPKEGFGLAVVEAQLAGLRLLLSRGIPDDALLPCAKYRRLPLAAGAESWARNAVDLMRESAPSACAAREALLSSPMEMNVALSKLLELYEYDRVP